MHIFINSNKVERVIHLQTRPPTFFCLGSKCRGNIVLCCPSSCSFFCLCVVKCILPFNFWTIEDGEFIFYMHSSPMKPYKISLSSMSCDLDFKPYAVILFRLKLGHSVSQTHCANVPYRSWKCTLKITKRASDIEIASDELCKPCETKSSFNIQIWFIHAKGGKP